MDERDMAIDIAVLKEKITSVEIRVEKLETKDQDILDRINQLGQSTNDKSWKAAAFLITTFVTIALAIVGWALGK